MLDIRRRRSVWKVSLLENHATLDVLVCPGDIRQRSLLWNNAFQLVAASADGLCRYSNHSSCWAVW